MPFPNVPAITWKFVGQPYDLNSVLSPDQVWAMLDQSPEQVRAALIILTNALNSVVDGSSGADNTGITPVASVSPTANTVQAIIEALVTLLQSTAVGSSGAKFIGSDGVAGLTGNDVQALLSALKTLADLYNTNQTNALNSHKSSADHDLRYYTQAQLDAGQLDSRYFTETEISTKVDMVKGAPASVGGVDSAKSNIGIIGGTGITITADNLAKTITITAQGISLPAPHASTHASGGSDPVSPASIGAATQTALDNLAGVGRTTETVKGVNDALVVHQADFAHKAGKIYAYKNIGGAL